MGDYYVYLVQTSPHSPPLFFLWTRSRFTLDMGYSVLSEDGVSFCVSLERERDTTSFEIPEKISLMKHCMHVPMILFSYIKKVIMLFIVAKIWEFLSSAVV